MIKNFEELQVGEWYLNRDGYPTKIVYRSKYNDFSFEDNFGHGYMPDGSFNDTGQISPLDLIQHIEEPVVVPKKVKVPKGRVLFSTIEDNGEIVFRATGGSYTEKEYKNIMPNPDAFVRILTEVPEFPVIMVDEE